MEVSSASASALRVSRAPRPDRSLRVIQVGLLGLGNVGQAVVRADHVRVPFRVRQEDRCCVGRHELARSLHGVLGSVIQVERRQHFVVGVVQSTQARTDCHRAGAGTRYANLPLGERATDSGSTREHDFDNVPADLARDGLRQLA